MKNKILILILLITVLILPVKSNAQFDKIILQFGIGIAQPMGDMKGTFYEYKILPEKPGLGELIFVNKDLITQNYGAKTGLDFNGNIKINFDKYGIVRGVGYISFTSFNTFEASQNANMGLLYRNPSTLLVDTTFTGISLSYTFRNFGLGFGLEIAPTSFTNFATPFFGANFAINILGGELSRAEGRDTNKITFGSELRLGVNFNAGLEFKVSKQIGIVAGVKYELANLLLKSSGRSLSDRLEWGKTNAPINDDGGTIWSSLPNILGDAIPSQYSSRAKNINWLTFYLGLNWHIPTSKDKYEPVKKYRKF